jgi:hypothetical protein
MKLSRALGGLSGLVAVLVLGWTCLRPPTGLEARVLATRSDQAFFERWLKIQCDLELRPMTRRALASGPTAIMAGAPDSRLVLKLPQDLRLWEVPAVVGDLERRVYGEDLPAFATSRTLAQLLEIALGVCRERVRTASVLIRWRERRRLAFLESWRGRVAQGQPPGQAGLALEAVPLPEALRRLGLDLPRRFPDLEQQGRLRHFLEAVQARPGELEELLARELEEALPFAAFQVGAQRLARGLLCFTQADLQAFRAKRKTLRTDPRALRLEEQPLWSMVGIPERALGLAQARRSGDRDRLAALELDAMTALQGAVAQFPWSEEEDDAARGAPALMLTSKNLRCVGMAVLIHACLRSLGIAHDGMGLPLHVAILARTADGREWVLDATGETAPKAMRIPLPAGRKTMAQALGYPDYACRMPAERLLAAAILWNQTSEHAQETPGRLHPWRQRFFAWNPEDLNALQSYYLRQTRPEGARLWLQRILRQTPDDPAAHLELWALERDRGQQASAQAVWAKAVAGAPTTNRP